MTTHHIGYGRLRLEQFFGDEEFARYDGSVDKVCEHQPHRTLNPTPPQLLLPDHVQVWIEYHTSNATKVYLHKTAIVYALTAEQAVQIETRQPHRSEL